MKIQMLQKLKFFWNLPRSLQSLIINSSVVAFGSFMVTPFLAIFLRNTLQLEPTVIGAFVAFSTFVQFGGGIVGALIAERLGLKKTMVFSLSFRTLGFALLALSPGLPTMLGPAIFLVAAGSAVYLPANRAYIVSSVAEDLKPLFLSISNAALSAGMALGPLVAAMVIDYNPSLLFYFVAALFIALALIHQATLIKDFPVAAEKRTSFRGLPSALSTAGRPVLFSTFAFYLYFFFQSFLGLYMAAISKTEQFGLVMLVNFTTIFLLQPLMAQKIAGLSFRAVLPLGYGLMALGFSLYGLNVLSGFLVGTVIMTAGQSILNLKCDIEVVRKLPGNPALAFGIQRLSTGCGGMITGFVGGWAFGLSQDHGVLSNFWLFVALNGVAAAIIGWIFAGKKINAMAGGLVYAKD